LDAYNHLVSLVIDFVWSGTTFAVLLGLGLLFTIWSKFIQFRALTHGVQVIRGKYDDEHDPGVIIHFQALSAALSGTVGLGNIGGVALAIGIGGPGALFWMWVTGFLGMAIKTVEVTLALMYRDTTDPEDPHGGAMYVVTRGWGDKKGGWAKPASKAVAGIFCVTLLVSAITGGNMFQAWNVGSITNEYFPVSPVISGVVMAALTALVIIGGIKRIGDVAGYLVPFMCGMYLLAGVVVLVLEGANGPRYLYLIVHEAFSPTKASGAFLGAGAWFGLTTGLRRALFSNEAGQGTSPIAHSAARTDEPVREGVVAGLEPFIDTCMVCTLTALVILCTGTWNREAVGEFKGEINLEKVIERRTPAGGDPVETVHWVVRAPEGIGNLPELPAPASWLPHNGFYLLARARGRTHRERGNDLIRITGRIREDRTIEWEPVEPSAEEWDAPPKEISLVDKGVHQDLVGASLTGHAFDRAVPGLGKWLVTVTCWLFAISTLISWSYYGEQGSIFLFGPRSVLPFKVLYCALTVVATLPGFVTSANELGNLSDLGTGIMLFANVPIILLMSPQAMRAFRDYFQRLDRGEMEPTDSSAPETP
jgi:AGCS family alanine or glycine:cation symporter